VFFVYNGFGEKFITPFRREALVGQRKTRESVFFVYNGFGENDAQASL
jgi:hypothetical protein